LIEDGPAFYKQIFKEFVPTKRGRPTFPTLNFDAPPTYCPFLPTQFFQERKSSKALKLKELEDKKRKRERIQFNSLTKEEQISIARKKGPKVGYCECCKVDYTDATKVPYFIFSNSNKSNN